MTIKGGVKSEPSDSVCGFIATGGKKKTVNTGVKPKGEMLGYYEQGSNIKVVYLSSNDKKKTNKLKICTFNSKYKLTSTKTVKLTGFTYKQRSESKYYHANDGSNYIFIGRDRIKTDKDQTYLKVIKYSKDWKKLKTISIKHKKSDYGTKCNYIDYDIIRYLVETDGDLYFSVQLSYDPGILFSSPDVEYEAYKLDLKTMKKVKAVLLSNSVYKDNTLFQSLTDGSSKVFITAKDKNNNTIIDASKKIGSKESNSSVKVYATEAGQKNIMTFGCYTKNNEYDHEKNNVFIVLTDRKTGKSKIKALTKNNEDNNINVGSIYIYKITDNCFVISYKEYHHDPKTDDLTIEKPIYVYIDGNGKILKKKSGTIGGKDAKIRKGFFVSPSTYRKKTGTKKVKEYDEFGDYIRTKTVNVYSDADYISFVKTPVYVKQ